MDKRCSLASKMVDDNPVRGKLYLIPSYESLSEPLFVPQIESTENGSRHRRTRVMRAALSALAARTSPNFGLILEGRRQGYSGCGLAAGELGVGHCGGISGGCRGLHSRTAAILLSHPHIPAARGNERRNRARKLARLEALPRPIFASLST